MLDLLTLQSRSLSLPRKATAAFRESLRSNPSKALRMGVLVDKLTTLMVKSYAIGFRERGLTFTKSRRIAVTNRYRKQARTALTQIQKSTNKELKRVYFKAVKGGATETQARRLVLRRFRTLGVTAPATNRFEALFRGASDSAYSQGRWESERLDPGVWGFRYVTKGDDKVRESHAQFHGVTLPKEHPFWTRVWPPIFWNCRCRVKPITRKQKLVYPPTNTIPIDESFIGQGFELR